MFPRTETAVNHNRAARFASELLQRSVREVWDSPYYNVRPPNLSLGVLLSSVLKFVTTKDTKVHEAPVCKVSFVSLVPFTLSLAGSSQSYSQEDSVKLVGIVVALYVAIFLTSVSAQDKVPKTIADSVGQTLHWTEDQFYSVAAAMPEAKYDYIPTAGNFEGARSFAEQVKHVACGNFAFFNEIEGKTPPDHCEKGGTAPAKTKPELLKYLKDSFDYGNKVLQTIDAKNALDRVEGRYAGPNTKLGIATAAVWHIADHYGQIVEYLRMNGIVPPATQQYGLKVR